MKKLIILLTFTIFSLMVLTPAETNAFPRLRKDVQELRQDRHEVRGDKIKLHHAIINGHPKAAFHFRNELRRDNRDRRCDRRDVKRDLHHRR